MNIISTLLLSGMAIFATCEASVLGPARRYSNIYAIYLDIEIEMVRSKIDEYLTS
jgi:hypothetical protein